MNDEVMKDDQSSHHSSLFEMPTFEGDLSAPAGRFAIVAAKFNSEVVDKLLAGALDGFSRHGVTADRIDVVRVPGAFEIPFVAQQLGESGSYAAIVCLGAVIKGETDHYEYICRAATDGITQAAPVVRHPDDLRRVDLHNR